MSLLFRIVYATHANGTHHKLALDALNAMSRPDAGDWQRVVLKHVERYLEGSKAPDVTFKDFKNHVLHVSENYWGGAPEKVQEWFDRSVFELKAGNWPDAVYALGVLSHYFTDPVMPFHTGQTEAENAIHRATEWSINRSYDTLRARGEDRFGRIGIAVPSGPKWLSEFVCDNAEFSHRYYEKLIGHYDIHIGATRPTEGLDDIAKDVVAELLIYAATAFGKVLDRAIAESGVAAPDVTLTSETFLAMTQIPRKFIEKRLANEEDRKLVAAIYDELRATGRVENALPEDDRVIRDLHAAEVLAPKLAEREAQRAVRVDGGDNTALELAVAKSANAAQAVTEPPPAIPQATTPPPVPRFDVASSDLPSIAARIAPLAPARPRATTLPSPRPREEGEGEGAPQHMSSQPAAHNDRIRSYLAESDDLEAAPSIGPKTAERFAAIGVATVGDFLKRDAGDMATALDDPHMDAETLAEWQDQARLVMTVRGLRGTHAQLLVGAGYKTAKDVAEADPLALSAGVLKYAMTSAGKRVLREGRPPDIEKIKSWVEFAKQAAAA
jgi:predicted flap endonuclease-1-like 5' DNA nuclease